MSEKNPWQIFSDECRGVADAYQQLMREVNLEGVLDGKTRCLVLVGIFLAIREAGALRHFVGEAIKSGASKREIEAAALLPFSIGVSSAELSIPIILDMVRTKHP
jgi:alkylhydroperoxidase/carboxymuconolactone decarboxylase family protein YurZ